MTIIRHTFGQGSEKGMDYFQKAAEFIQEALPKKIELIDRIRQLLYLVQEDADILDVNFLPEDSDIAQFLTLELLGETNEKHGELISMYGSNEDGDYQVSFKLDEEDRLYFALTMTDVEDEKYYFDGDAKEWRQQHIFTEHQKEQIYLDSNDIIEEILCKIHDVTGENLVDDETFDKVMKKNQSLFDLYLECWNLLMLRINPDNPVDVSLVPRNPFILYGFAIKGDGTRLKLCQEYIGEEGYSYLTTCVTKDQDALLRAICFMIDRYQENPGALIPLSLTSYAWISFDILDYDIHSMNEGEPTEKEMIPFLRHFEKLEEDLTTYLQGNGASMFDEEDCDC